MSFQHDLAREEEVEEELICTILYGELSMTPGATRDGYTSVDIEVKHDYKSHETGNVAIEVSCSGKPSWINVWHWFIFYVLGEFKRENIYRASKKYIRSKLQYYFTVQWWDWGRAELVLLPLSTFHELFLPLDLW